MLDLARSPPAQRARRQAIRGSTGRSAAATSGAIVTDPLADNPTLRDCQVATSSLAPGMLISVPRLQDPFFSRTVIMLVEHGPEGAYGVVLNRRAPVDMATLLDGAGLAVDAELATESVWWGGPVHPETGVVLYLEEPGLDPYEPATDVLPGLRLSSSMDLLRDVANGRGPRTLALYLGRASWGPGQIEAELEQGSWIPADTEDSLLFSEQAGDLWEAALRSIGVDPAYVASGDAAQA